MESEERKNRNIGLITSIGFHGLVLFVLFSLIAWKAPESPLPGYGVQLNFGLDDEGTGEIQPEEPSVTKDDTEEAKHEEEQKAEEAKPNDVAEEQEQLVSQLESPVVVKEEKKETKKEPVKEKVIEPEKALAEYKKEEKKESKTDGKTDGGKSTASHGDDANKKGDKGDPEGSLDAKALYGKQGGGGGNGVSLSGFNGFDWPKVVSPDLPDQAEGVYEFIVKVDEQGDVISVTPARRGLSLEAERRFKDMVQRLEFIPKGMNLPPESEGRITFKVVSR